MKITVLRAPQSRAGDSWTSYPPPDWLWDHCPIDLSGEEAVAEGHAQDPDNWTGCVGCPGWGMECGSVWTRKLNHLDIPEERTAATRRLLGKLSPLG
jgi:hypothetical protein